MSTPRVVCPKCGQVVKEGHEKCSFCNYSKENSITTQEAREFTSSG
ncbi:MAG: hypothetical protein ACYC7D_03540 [Nitrososphaerales archaeon]